MQSLGTALVGTVFCFRVLEQFSNYFLQSFLICVWPLMAQEGARLESRRLRVVEAEEQEPTSKQLAKAMGMKTKV